MMRSPRWLGIWFLGSATFLSAGCDQTPPKPAEKKASASKVEALPGEADLTTVTISEKAETQLGIATAKIETKDVPRSRTLGGDVVVPAGHLLTVASPLSGTLHSPKSGTPEAGAKVKAGQVLFELMPLLSPETQATMSTAVVEAQGQIDQAETLLAQAKQQYDRAERLLRGKVGAPGAVADASAQVEVANAALTAAKKRREAIEKALQGLTGGSLKPLPIEAEADGILKNLHAAPGQKVAPGALLFEIVSTDPMNVRVPVYVADLARIDENQAVEIVGISDPPGAPSKKAKPIPAPPSADPLGSTVDLFYSVANPDGSLRPGQRVGVTVLLRGTSSGLTAPKSAILRDYNGGAWVYTVAGPHKYARKRVGVASVVGDDALLTFGPPAGTAVVTTGSAELFGIEFGGNK